MPKFSCSMGSAGVPRSHPRLLTRHSRLNIGQYIVLCNICGAIDSGCSMEKNGNALPVVNTIAYYRPTAYYWRATLPRRGEGQLTRVTAGWDSMSSASSNAVSDAAAVHAAILAEYRAKTPRSSLQYARAARALAGGTTGNLRHFHPYPLYFAYGRGSEMVDIDGNAYVDCFLCNGPLLLGHRHPGVMSAIREHEHVGSLIVNPTLGVTLAEKIQQVIPSAQRIRFLNSGTEAVLTAVRLARAFTGKRKIVKFFGHYHGQDDQFLVGLDSSGGKFGSGIPDEAIANAVLVKYGDIDALSRAFDEDSEIGAVILDPAMHSGGLWGSSTRYLREVRALTAGR